MQIDIIGNGSFGLFLRKILSPHAEITSEARIKILAIPYSSYMDAIQNQLHDKDGYFYHPVNVCSIQEETNRMLRDIFRGNFTGIHPMFGARSPEEGRTSIITHAEPSTISREVIALFSKVSECYYLDEETHDKFMALTHAKVVEISDTIQKIVNDAKDIPDFILPSSFKKLKDFSKTFLDMPEGTKSSIMANKYIK